MTVGFLEIALLVGVALVVSAIMYFLRQPLIIGHLITGILVSPYVFGIVQTGEGIESFAHIGVALLLFLVGLNLSPKTLKETGKASLFTGISQILFTSIIGYGILRLLDFSHIESLYLAIALAFSSTIIISKLLSDKGDLQALYGRISIGFLIVQDIVAIVILVLLTGLAGFDSFIQDLVLLLIIAGVAFFTLPKITPYMARSQELLVLYAIGWCLLLAALFQYFNFSIEAGALLAGMALSNSRYRFEIAARLKPLRDFFILMFFILLGTQMEFSGTQVMLPAILLSAFVIIGNPLIVMSIMGVMGYARKVGFQAGLTVAQISEFSLIIVALGVGLGHISGEVLAIATIIALITIGISTYMILYADAIFNRLSPFLKFFEKKHVRATTRDSLPHDIILLGCNQIGLDIVEDFKKLSENILVVDYDPNAFEKIAAHGVNTRYGDAHDLELLADLQFSQTKLVVSTTPNFSTNLLVLDQLRKENDDSLFITLANDAHEALELYDAGATNVLLPHHVGSSRISALLEKNGLDEKKYLLEKNKHIEQLRKHK